MNTVWQISLNGKISTATLEDILRWPMPPGSYILYQGQWITQGEFRRLQEPPPEPPPPKSSSNLTTAIGVGLVLVLLSLIALTLKVTFTPHAPIPVSQPTASATPTVRSAAPAPTVTATQAGPTITATATPTWTPRPSWTGPAHMWEWWEEIPHNEQVGYCREYLQDPVAAYNSWTSIARSADDLASSLRILKWLNWYCPQWTSDYTPHP